MELKYASKIACGPRHFAVRQRDFSQTYCDATSMVPKSNRYNEHFLTERLVQYSPPPAYVSTRSRADIQLEMQRKKYGFDRSSPTARDFSYRELRDRFTEVQNGIQLRRAVSPLFTRQQKTSPQWVREITHVESNWAGGAQFERRV